MLKPDYCTQNNGDCFNCSLVNYGRDCQNNMTRPICCQKPMTINKRIARVSGQRIQYLCRLCGKTVTVKQDVTKL